ncbi:hypothetical protein IFM89_000786 [Coptis chinensis]|uniref:BHLH domain-containing protein n=1 Tax=Coptis chinensis TaxID=261450 RepID=A0A835IW05_9MAGN|nr:hypothetical protein IFM89_000786 [Coptis chinensis]
MGMNISPYYEMVDHQFEAVVPVVIDREKFAWIFKLSHECEVTQSTWSISPNKVAMIICGSQMALKVMMCVACSIDSLLDQTIKHASLFLRSVTNRNEKLKRLLTKNLELFEDRGKGKWCKWAVKMGSQLEVCPIVVKDLEQPGHMLIEVCIM